MGLPLIRRGRPRIAALGLVTLLFVAACSPSADDTETAAAADSSTTTTEGTTATTYPQENATTEPSITTTTATTTTTSTLPPTTTSTTAATTTTTRPPTTTTTLAVPPGNEPPTVEIISPAHLSSHIAVYDAEARRFGAAVSLSAVVSDPNGDEVTVQWISSDEGLLGTGESMVAILHTGQFDSAQPRITARATDQWGTSTEASVQIIVWIPSDT